MYWKIKYIDKILVLIYVIIVFTFLFPNELNKVSSNIIGILNMEELICKKKY